MGSRNLPVPALDFENQKSLVAQFNARRIADDMTYKTELAHLHSALVANDDLCDCVPDSFAETVIQCGSIGLSLNPKLGHAYAVPYRVNNEKRCTLAVGYKGMMHIVSRAATIRDVQANLVCENDPEFTVWTDVAGTQIKHVQARSNRGAVTHAYCIAHYSNGGHHVEVMDIEDLNRCMAAAKTKYVWDKWYGQMCKKSVIRRAFGQWPKDDGGYIERALSVMDEFEPMDFTQGSGEPEICLDDQQQLELHAHLTDGGLDSQQADKWLKRLARVNNFASVADMPASRFEDYKKQLSGYLDQWRAKK